MKEEREGVTNLLRGKKMRKINITHLMKRVYIQTHSERIGFLAGHVSSSKTEVKHGSVQHQTLLLNLCSR